MSNCKVEYLDGLSELRSLKRLSLMDCDSLRLPGVSKLTMLRVLEIHRCRRIREIKGLGELTSLEKLDVNDCKVKDSSRVKRAQKSIAKRLGTSG
ncbi:hypothetical protein NL676_007701 [Syzygium grande]|nr:hypothetical protein NL676_007701 [Syzygium grande]